MSLEEKAYEPALQRGPTVRLWLSYLGVLKGKFHGFDLWSYYERAVGTFPRSYKIWIDYLDARISAYTENPDEDEKMAVYHCFDSALINLWTCPRIWLNFMDFARRMKDFSRLNEIMNRALRALPITQHDRLWEAFMPAVKDSGDHSLMISAYKRLLKLHPERIEDAAEWFAANGPVASAVTYIQAILDKPDFVSVHNRTKFYWWNALADLLESNLSYPGLDRILLQRRAEYALDSGRATIILSNFYTKQGRYLEAIDILESHLEATASPSDFAVVFEGAAKLYQLLMDHHPHSDLFKDKLSHLLDRHPVLLNACQIRQSPHNVMRWVEKSALFMDLPYSYTPRGQTESWQRIEHLIPQRSQLCVLQEAIETVNPRWTSDGYFSDLWISLSKISDDFRPVLDFALEHPANLQSDLVRIYCYYGEQEIKSNNVDNARTVMQNAIEDRRLIRFPASVNLWSLAIDIEWCYGTSTSIQTLFEACMKSNVISLRHILGYVQFLEKTQQFDVIFRVYERGLKIADASTEKVLWLRYLSFFVKTYGDTKVHRARDLFSRALQSVCCTEIVVLYVQFELKYGLYKNAMRILDEMSLKIDSEELYHFYLRTALDLYGVSKVRQVYQTIINRYKDRRASEWSIRFAQFEAKLNELDRSRSIWIHGSQFADPEKMPELWDAWNRFETQHGTKDTFAEMLSYKNVAVARFNRSVHIGLANEGKGLVPEDVDEELAEVEAARLAGVQEQKIAETIFDAGSFTKAERLAKLK